MISITPYGTGMVGGLSGVSALLWQCPHTPLSRRLGYWWVHACAVHIGVPTVSLCIPLLPVAYFIVSIPCNVLPLRKLSHVSPLEEKDSTEVRLSGQY